jgi:hypothetical protein
MTEDNNTPLSDLLCRGDVIDMLIRLATNHADLAIYGEPADARKREAMEAAFTHARCAVALMPRANSPTNGEAVAALAKVIREAGEDFRLGASGPEDSVHDFMAKRALWSLYAHPPASSVKEPGDEITDDMLRAFYEAQCPPGDSPAGGFTRWAPWEEARVSRAPEIRKCIAAMMAVKP